MEKRISKKNQTMLTLDSIRSSLPKGQLRQGESWLFSPRPFALSKAQARQIQRLGHPLAKFQRLSDRLYRQSASGKSPSWIAELLDQGKPQWMVQQQRSPELRSVFPRVIRPDLILTEQGFSLTELDSVPGGIGITAWLSQLYADAGFSLLGGKKGMLEGFASLFEKEGENTLLISEESADYRPEMEWLAQQSDFHLSVQDAESAKKITHPSYRFFEWFDWQNIAGAEELAASDLLTSPCKPHLEEKLWLALWWCPALRAWWKEHLRGNHLNLLQQVIPFSWVVDNTPLPPHACLPRLEVQTWQEVAEFSQSQRELVLKISGFNELAWGSRGVYIGHDMPAQQWKNCVHHALENKDQEAWIMQDFKQGQIVEHPYFDPHSGEVKIMKGRARLCPYYFTDKKGFTSLGGILATIVPADKKKIHGMKDGILVPCMLVED